MTLPSLPTALAATAACPCGRTSAPPAARPLAYGACCGRWHAGPEQCRAPDAESLMRSRYSAFVLGLHDYLLATWHPRTRPVDLAPPEPGLRWLGLTVQRSQQTAKDQASVQFVARSKLGGRAHRLAEHSRFLREADGRWYYLDGDAG